MKKTLILLAILALAGGAKAQQVTRDDWQSLQVEFNVGNVTVDEITLADETFSILAIEGYYNSDNNYGSPALPTFSQLIEVPLCDGFDVVVSDAVYDTLPVLEHRLMPVQLPRRKSDTSAFRLFISKEVYSWNAFVGQRQAEVEAVGIARDRRLARLQFSPVQYNPATGQVVVCRKATVTVNYVGADREATLEMFNRYHSPAFQSGAQVMNSLYPKGVRTAAPVRYLIVANSMFRGQMDDFVQWKRRKGFITDIVYTDNPAVGTTTTSIQTYIKSQYTGATADSPAPTYVLLVGDVEQLPAFSAAVTYPSSNHITDLYYMTWTTGDNLPDCHYGRFSAQTIAQLTPQVEKTLMYEQYTFADPSFLDRAVMVAGVDGGSSGDYGYTHADPAMDYAVTNYVNGAHGFANVYYFKNNTSITPSGVSNVTVSSSASGNAATVRSYYNLGAGFINYSAHGGSTGWGTPNFGNTHVASMTNTQKFGLMIGNCCLTNKFEVSTCFGEALLRKDGYCGAVGYIGGSNSTYWNEDFYWAVGLRSGIGPSMSMAYNASNLGVYDRAFHTHGEAYSNWCTTQGSMIMQGNMAVESSTSGLKAYYWEIYHLMGDPSVMPYLTQADTMVLAVSPVVQYGTATLSVAAAPYAYVALTDTLTGTLVAAAYAGSTGAATLSLPTTLPVGTYLLAASAQQYRTAFMSVSVIQPAGAYPAVTAINSAPLNAGDTVPLTLHVENLGDTIARNIVIGLASGNPHLTLNPVAVTLDSLPAGASVDIASTVVAYVAADATDNSAADVVTTVTWTGGTLTAATTLRMYLYAPVLSLAFSTTSPCLLPGNTLALNATLRNNGHAPSHASALTFGTPTALLSAGNVVSMPFAMAPSSDTTVAIVLSADAALPVNITIPLNYSYGAIAGSLPVFIGQAYSDNFEGGTTHLSGWTPATTYPWTIIDSQAVVGTHCMRSAVYMGHSQNSDMTLNINVEADDSVSFYYRVSSESNYDKFHFLVDSVSVFNASGEVDWTRAAFAISAGSHTLTFRYAKDYSVSSGSDCAWIDNVTVPAPRRNAVFSTVELCQGDIRIVGTDTIGQEPGNYATVSGDSIVEYIVHPTYAGVSDIAVCDSLVWNAVTHFVDFSYSTMGTTVYGCDSSSVVNVHVNHSAYDTLVVTTQASNYRWHGRTYTESGEYTDTLATAAGCDSIVTLMLTFDRPNNGIAQPDGVAITVYPVPTTGMVHLSAEVAAVEVYDMQGRRVLTCGITAAIDLGALPQGIYLMRVTTVDGATATCRVERL